MAFNQVGDFWLAPGESTRIHLALGGLVDEAGGRVRFRPQWIARPTASGSTVRLMVSEHTRKEAHSPAPRFTWSIVYSVTVTNIGEELAHFTIQGGGNV